VQAFGDDIVIQAFQHQLADFTFPMAEFGWPGNALPDELGEEGAAAKRFSFSSI